MSNKGIIVPDQKIWKAADLFAKGEHKGVEDILIEALGKKMAKNVIKATRNSHLNDDSGYEDFLEAVNKELGQPVYVLDDYE